MARRYRLQARAERQQDTRERIVKAAVELHATVGPARTSLSAVAERAGVSRPTIYAYFPDRPTLFAACSEAAMTADPWPDPRSWGEIADPVARLHQALNELYAYYRRNERLTSNILRDLDFLPQVPGRSLDAGQIAMRTALSEGWQVADDRQELLLAALDHVVDFQAWRSLAHPHALDDDQVIELMAALVVAAAGSREPGRRARRS